MKMNVKVMVTQWLLGMQGKMFTHNLFSQTSWGYGGTNPQSNEHKFGALGDDASNFKSVFGLCKVSLGLHCRWNSSSIQAANTVYVKR